MTYEFADCALDIDRRELMRNGVLVPLEPQVFDLLQMLVENPGRVVTRDEIVDGVWGGRIVSESAMSARISAARKAVGDDGKSQAVIRTVQRKGLQFVARLAVAGVVRAPTTATQRVKYTANDQGQSLAYTVTGSGPRLMRVPATPEDIGLEWEHSVYRQMIEEISNEFEYLRYDGLGFGLSDHDIDDKSFERDANDCRAVADAESWDRFAVMSESGACFEALHLGVMYPERISRLVIVGGYSEGRSLRGEPDAPDMLRAMIRESWESEEEYLARAFVTAYMPEGPMDAVNQLAQRMRAGASTEEMTRLRDAINAYSVLPLLPKVQCPTLIVHGRKDAVHPLSEAKKLAAGIPNSELLILETANHIPVHGHATWNVYLEALCRFLKP